MPVSKEIKRWCPSSGCFSLKLVCCLVARLASNSSKLYRIVRGWYTKKSSIGDSLEFASLGSFASSAFGFLVVNVFCWFSSEPWLVRQSKEKPMKWSNDQPSLMRSTAKSPKLMDEDQAQEHPLQPMRQADQQQRKVTGKDTTWHK